MRAALLAFLFVTAGSLAASAATDDELRSQILGKWGETADCKSGLLIFNADGSFASTDASGQSAADQNGTYAISGGKLNGKAGERTMPEVTISFDGDTMTFAIDADRTEKLSRCK
jgi:uncharacterized protein (TIGR03066 family)